MQGLCSSLCFGREKEPRETMLHASMQTKCRFFALGCGTRYAQTGPRPIFDAMLNHLILLLHLSLLQQF